MKKTIFRFSTTISLLSAIIFTGASTQAQDLTELSANEQCNKVMLIVAEKRAKDYGINPCDNNAYPAEFWQCVEKEIEQFDLSMSIYFCEQEFGFK